MKLTYSDVPANITSHFDDEQPLGPVSADRISDPDVAAYLLQVENHAAYELLEGASILFGRKGAGKSSLLQAYMFPRMIKSKISLAFEEFKNSKFHAYTLDRSRKKSLFVSIEVHDHIEFIHEQLSKKSTVTPEGAAKIWKAALWRRALWEISRRPVMLSSLSSSLQDKLRNISRLSESLSMSESTVDYFDQWLLSGDGRHLNESILLPELRSELERLQISVTFIIDSMEEYKVYDDLIRSAIGGLLHLVGTDSSRNVYKIAFPYEIYDSVKSEANSEKYKIQSVTIKWKNFELIKIITNRMLICLYLRENDFLFDVISSDDFANKGRRGYMLFWQKIFGNDILNEANNLEPGLLYILRHTQMLPRQLINTMSRLVKKSKVDLRSYRHISPDAITSSLKETCDDLVEGIESGFKYTYPRARVAFDDFLPRCPICATYGELQSIFANSAVKGLGEEYTLSFSIFLRSLIHMGVFGVRRQETDLYIEADFGYIDETILRFSENDIFAMHPAFSLLYKGGNFRMNLGKAVLPRGTFDGLE